jgi:hypothetical protein
MKNEKIKYTLIGFVEGFITMLLIAAFVALTKGCFVTNPYPQDANNSGGINTSVDDDNVEAADQNNYDVTPRVKRYDEVQEATNNKGQKTLSVLAANKIVIFKDDSSARGNWTIEIPKSSFGNDIFETKTKKLRIILSNGNEITSSRSVSDYE